MSKLKVNLNNVVGIFIGGTLIPGLLITLMSIFDGFKILEGENSLVSPTGYIIFIVLYSLLPSLVFFVSYLLVGMNKKVNIYFLSGVSGFYSVLFLLSRVLFQELQINLNYTIWIMLLFGLAILFNYFIFKKMGKKVANE